MSVSFHQYRLVLAQPSALTECVWRKVEKTAAGSMKRWTRPCCQGEVLLPVSYGNQCSRMQSIAKQVTLALTATHKTLKNQGALAVAWEQKEGINGVRNKASVWLELRNTQHDFWYVP